MDYETIRQPNDQHKILFISIPPQAPMENWTTPGPTADPFWPLRMKRILRCPKKNCVKDVFEQMIHEKKFKWGPKVKFDIAFLLLVQEDACLKDTFFLQNKSPLGLGLLSGRVMFRPFSHRTTSTDYGIKFPCFFICMLTNIDKLSWAINYWSFQSFDDSHFVCCSPNRLCQLPALLGFRKMRNGIWYFYELKINFRNHL